MKAIILATVCAFGVCGASISAQSDNVIKSDAVKTYNVYDPDYYSRQITALTSKYDSQTVLPSTVQQSASNQHADGATAAKAVSSNEDGQTQNKSKENKTDYTIVFFGMLFFAFCLVAAIMKWNIVTTLLVMNAFGDEEKNRMVVGTCSVIALVAICIAFLKSLFS